MIDNGDGTFWAQPDNGFGAKGNSADFYLRLGKDGVKEPTVIVVHSELRGRQPEQPTR